MAWQIRKTNLTIVFKDDDGATSRETVSFDSETFSQTQIQAYTASYIALIGAASDAAINAYTLTTSFYNDAFPTAAAGSDVEDKGVLMMETANGGTAMVTIPSVLESLLINTGSERGRLIDTSATAMAAVIAALITGIAGVAPIGGSGFDLARLTDAYKQNRSSLKSRGRKG